MVSAGTLLVVAYALGGVSMLPFAWLFARQQTRGSNFMALGALGTVFTGLAYAASLRAAGVETTLAWYYVYLVTISGANLAFFAFTLVWTDRREYLRWGVVVPLALATVGVPAFGLVDVALAGVDYRAAFWATPGVLTVAGRTVFDRTPGPVVLVWRFVATVNALAMLGVLAEFTVRPEQRLYRRQNGLLVGGLLAVVVLTVVAQLLGVPVEVVPLTYVGLAGVFAIAIGGYGRFEVVPLATDSIVEEIDAGVLAYDAQGRVLDANRNAVRALGAPDPAGEFLPALLAGADSVTLDTDGDLETLEARLDGHEFTAEEDGRRRRYSASVSEIHDPASRAAGRALLLYDVTEQYRRQQQLERANERLEQFADVVSHDLRNPLHVASGHLELAREGRTESFDEVEAALERIDEIVENVLTLARQGEAIGETEPVSLERVAREAWSHVPTGDATLSVVTDATVQADRDRLVQLFENLFRNSLDHAGSGVAVTVGATDVLYVEDDGPGIPAGERESVFESGYTTGAGNTGLGLAIVEEIADAHGWEVRVTEGTDGGARFEFDGPAFE